MQCFKGKSVYEGTAMGPIKILKKKEGPVERVVAENVSAEMERLEKALQYAGEQLQILHRKALDEVGRQGADIFEVHGMLLQDEDYLESVREMIRRENVKAEYAVQETGRKFAGLFEEMEDAYMQARAADIIDVSGRVIRCLQGKETSYEWNEPAVVLAEELSPGETMQLDKTKLLGIVTKRGSVNSHAAILAGMMNIPALTDVAVQTDELQDGMMAIVDSVNNRLITEPDEETMRATEIAIQKQRESRAHLQELIGKDNITTDGTRINIFANIGSVEDIPAVLENDAGGIGLFRSEFLFMGRDTAPSEEEQFHVYKQIARQMKDKKVIIRTLDIGADKQADYMIQGKEENPAMGYRAIRICLKKPEFFMPQIKAILRAAVYGNIAVMYPMIISCEEITAVKDCIIKAEKELQDMNIPYRIPEQGIMIETPAAALISDELAEMIDFFCIGTNDLTQYTLAIDRQNDKLDDFYDAHHKAVFRLIEMVVQNGHNKGIWVGICGELAADISLTEYFLRIGVDELSVAPSAVLKLREAVRTTDLHGSRGY